MADFETAEDIQRRWNPAPNNGLLSRMVGEEVPIGDTRATVAAGNAVVTHKEVDHSIPEGTTTLQPANGGATVTDEYTGMSHDDLKGEIDTRNEDRDEDSQISKGGSSDDLRARLREADAETDDGDDS